jgi:hypothetical protein
VHVQADSAAAQSSSRRRGLAEFFVADAFDHARDNDAVAPSIRAMMMRARDRRRDNRRNDRDSGGAARRTVRGSFEVSTTCGMTLAEIVPSPGSRLKIRQQLEQECLELVGAVDLVDQQHRRLSRRIAASSRCGGYFSESGPRYVRILAAMRLIESSCRW